MEKAAPNQTLRGYVQARGCCVSLRCSVAASHHSHCLLLTLISAAPGGKDKASSEDGLSGGRANAQTRPSYHEVYVQRSHFCSQATSEYSLSAVFKPDRRTCQPMCLSMVPNRSYKSALIAFTFHCHFSRKSLLN